MAVKQLPTLSPIPEPPNRLVGDQERFDTMTFNSLKAQEKMVNVDLNQNVIPALNQFAVDVNASVDAAKASETSALASKNSAASSAGTATTKAGKAAALVHDLDSLRRIGGSAARGSDQLLLPGFEALIVHSQRMESYLRTVGVTCPMILMEAFDCLSEGEIPVREKSRMVAIAGNLAADKSGYLKDIGKVPLEWQLYGTNWAGSGSTRIEYHGEIAPEKLPETISGAFGIVWDGDSLDGLTGLYGAYALLNSPHKLSTYLAGGLPVIVAKNAAAADFVAREQVGVVLNSLRELPELIRTMPEEDYQRYAANARRVGAQLRAGENTKRALRKLEEVE